MKTPFDNLEKKKKIIKLRLGYIRHLENVLKGYKATGDKELLKFAKELGKESVFLKEKIKELDGLLN